MEYFKKGVPYFDREMSWLSFDGWLLVRSICCLVSGKEGFSENITVKSIVGRFLEHARVFMFHNDGNPEMYAGLADWMARNLKRRVEVVFPVYDSAIFKHIETMMN